MKVLVFSGTTEGREISSRCAALGFDTTVSVASGYGREMAERDAAGSFGRLTVVENRLSEEEMERVFLGFDCVVDATHPFAVEVTANIARACAAVGKPCLRLLRKKTAFPLDGQSSGNGECFFESDSMDAMCADLAAFDKSRLERGLPLPVVFVSTGSKNISCFERLSMFPDRFYFRVLPSVDSISACIGRGVPSKNIIAMQGPFSELMNEAMFRDTGAGALVTKESGRNGGFFEKVSAAKKCGMAVFSVRRPVEEGYNVFEDIGELEKELGRLDEGRVLDWNRNGKLGGDDCRG